MLDQTSQAAEQSAAPETASQTTPEAAPKPAVQAAETKADVKVVTPEEKADIDAKAAADDTKTRQLNALQKLREAKAARDGTPLKPTATADATAKALPTDKPADGKQKDPKTGQFVAKTADGVAAQTGDKAAKKTEAPSSWTKEAKAHWDKLDPGLQTFLSDQQRNVAQSFSNAGRERAQMQRALESYKPIGEAVSKHTDTLKSWGLTPDAAFDGLMETAKQLHTNPRDAIAKIAQDYGVNLASFAADLDPSQLPPDPRLEVAATEIMTLRRQLADANRLRAADQAELKAWAEGIQEQNRQAQQYEQQQTQHKVRGEIDKWADQMPYFNDLQEDIAALYLPAVLNSGKFRGNNEAALRQAYKLALASNETLSKADAAKQAQDLAAKQAAESNRAIEAARTAARLNAPMNANTSGISADDGRAAQYAALKRARDTRAQGRSAYAV